MLGGGLQMAMYGGWSGVLTPALTGARLPPAGPGLPLRAHTHLHVLNGSCDRICL